MRRERPVRERIPEDFCICKINDTLCAEKSQACIFRIPGQPGEAQE